MRGFQTEISAAAFHRPIACNDLVKKGWCVMPSQGVTISQLLGVVATGLVIAGYLPQIVHLIRERCTAGISVLAFSVWCVAAFLFLIHAAMIRDAVFIGVQTVNLVAGGLIIWFAKKNEGQVCAYHREAYGKAESAN